MRILLEPQSVVPQIQKDRSGGCRATETESKGHVRIGVVHFSALGCGHGQEIVSECSQFGAELKTVSLAGSPFLLATSN